MSGTVNSCVKEFLRRSTLNALLRKEQSFDHFSKEHCKNGKFIGKFYTFTVNLYQR
jgi:hypothetical protein